MGSVCCLSTSSLHVGRHSAVRVLQVLHSGSLRGAHGPIMLLQGNPASDFMAGYTPPSGPGGPGGLAMARSTGDFMQGYCPQVLTPVPAPPTVEGPSVWAWVLGVGLCVCSQVCTGLSQGGQRLEWEQHCWTWCCPKRRGPLVSLSPLPSQGLTCYALVHSQKGRDRQLPYSPDPFQMPEFLPWSSLATKAGVCSMTRPELDQVQAREEAQALMFQEF